MSWLTAVLFGFSFGPVSWYYSHNFELASQDLSKQDLSDANPRQSHCSLDYDQSSLHYCRPTGFSSLPCRLGL